MKKLVKLNEKKSKTFKRVSHFLFLAVLTVIGLSGCNDDPDDIDNPIDAPTVVIQQGDAERISTENAGVVALRNAANTTKSASLYGEEEIVSDMPLVLVAEVEALTYNGTILRSTHVCINGSYAYVSYNYEGDSYMGAVDMIDISDPYNPFLVESAVFTETDISSIAYADNTLYLAGAREFIDGDDTNPAILLKMNLNNGSLTDEVKIIDMPGYVATDVALGDSYIYGVSGDNGILGAYNYNNNSLAASASLNDLRSVGVSNGQVVILQNGSIKTFDASTLTQSLSFSTPTDVTEAKRTIDFYGTNVLAAEGANGTGIYNLSNGEKLTSIPVADATGLDVADDEVVTNAVSVNNEHIFIANGGVGVSVVSINSENIADLTDFGSLDLDGSANYVKSEDNLVFVADGFGGLKILKIATIDGGSDGGSGELDCSQYPAYTGGNWLNVNSGQTLEYSGSASLTGVNVNENLTWCGSLATSSNLNVNSGGTFYMKGYLSVGNTSSSTSLAINASSKLIMEGDLVIYGDLILNSNSTLEFSGTGSTITIYGNVTIGDNVTIAGTYTDTYNKLNQ